MTSNVMELAQKIGKIRSAYEKKKQETEFLSGEELHIARQELLGFKLEEEELCKGQPKEILDAALLVLNDESANK